MCAHFGTFGLQAPKGEQETCDIDESSEQKEADAFYHALVSPDHPTPPRASNPQACAWRCHTYAPSSTIFLCEAARSCLRALSSRPPHRSMVVLSAADIRAGMLAAGGAPVAKVVPSQQVPPISRL